MKKILSAILLVVASVVGANAQQPQTSTAPLSSTNVKFNNGVGTGYWPTKGSGLVLNVAAGTSFCSGTTIFTYAGGTLTLTDNSTNYVFLDSSCTLGFNTSGFTTGDIPIATVTTSSGAITAIQDDRTMMVSPPSGGGGGLCSNLASDSTSINCGTNGSGYVTDNGPPFNVNMLGNGNLTGGADTIEVVAIGDTNYIGDNFTDTDIVAIGDQNGSFTGQFQDNSVMIGNRNAGSSSVCRMSDAVNIGDTNWPICPTNSIGDVVSIGTRNNDFTVSAGFSSPNFGTNVAIGNNNISSGNNTIHAGALFEIVAIGDTNVRNFKSCTDCIAIGDFTLQAGNGSTDNISASGIVAIGEVAAEGLLDGSSADVFIGVAAGDIANGLSGATTETIGIGDSACDNCTADDNIAIGNSALDGGFGSPRNNTGNNNIGIGQLALAANTTGTENTAIGTNAGCVGCSPSSNGTGNRTGSHNVWIGDSAGQSVAGTTNIDDSIAIGFNAQNTASNQAIFGGPAVTQTITYGIYTPGTIYSAAGTPLPSCTSGLNGSSATVSDATAPTYLGTYTSGGTVTTHVICNGATTTWLTD